MKEIPTKKEIKLFRKILWLLEYQLRYNSDTQLYEAPISIPKVPAMKERFIQFIHKKKLRQRIGLTHDENQLLLRFASENWRAI